MIPRDARPGLRMVCTTDVYEPHFVAEKSGEVEGFTLVN